MASSRSPRPSFLGAPVRVALALAVGLIPALVFGPVAHAQKDLGTDGTIKNGGESTVKDPGTTGTKDLSTTGTSLETAPKPTFTAPKPSTSASASDSSSAAPETSASAAPSTSASSSGPKAFVHKKLKLEVGDFAISVGFPGDWPLLADDDLPEIDTTPPEGGAPITVVLKKGWGFHKPNAKPPHVAELVVACAKTSAEGWGDNIRDAAFSSMLDQVEKAVGEYTSLKQIDPDPVRVEDNRIVEPFHAEAQFSADGNGKTEVAAAGSEPKKKPGDIVKVQGLSFFGFKDESSGAPTLLACTITCAHLPPEGEKGVCGDVVQALEITGTFSAPPKRSWLAELVFAFKRDKTTGYLVLIGIVFGLILIGVLIALLVRKKKPSASPTGTHDAVEDEEVGFQAGYEAGLAAARKSSGPPGQPTTAGGASSIEAASAPPAAGYVDPKALPPT